MWTRSWLIMALACVCAVAEGGTGRHAPPAFIVTAGQAPARWSAALDFARVKCGPRQSVAVVDEETRTILQDKTHLRPPLARSAKYHRRPLNGGAATASCVMEVGRTRTETEVIGDLIGSGEVSLKVREARIGEGDAVALLRCRAFDQGKDVFRSQLVKMMSGANKANHKMAGRSRTNFLVSSAEVLSDDGRACAMNLILSDLDRLLDDGWVTPQEHYTRKKRLKSEWKDKADVIIGSVDCAVHEFVNKDLMLVKSLYISSMAVRDGFRNMGVGCKLLDGAHRLAVEYRVRDMYLHVEEDNTPAVRLYKSAGFERADMDDQSTFYMDRALRLLLQVPVKAQLYRASLKR